MKQCFFFSSEIYPLVYIEAWINDFSEIASCSIFETGTQNEYQIEIEAPDTEIVFRELMNYVLSL